MSFPNRAPVPVPFLRILDFELGFYTWIFDLGLGLRLAIVYSRAAHEAGALPDSQARLLLPRQHIRQNL